MGENNSVVHDHKHSSKGDQVQNLDTGIHMPPIERRYEALLRKEYLMARGSQNIAVQGSAGPDWREKYAPLGDARAARR